MILKEVVEQLKPVLEEYATQLKQIENKIRKTGTIDLSICGKCSRRDIQQVSKFDGEGRKVAASFLKWVSENDIRGLSSSGETLAFQSSRKSVEDVEGNIPLLEIGQALSASTEKVVYDYRISVAKMKKKDFAALLKQPFADLSSCKHLVSLPNEACLAVVTKQSRDTYVQGIEKLWQESQSANHYVVYCKDCFGRIDSVGCEDSIRKEAFTYVHNCPIQSILFRNLLVLHNIGYVESTERKAYSEGRVMVSLPDLETFVADSSSHIESAIEALSPETLLVFGPKESLVYYLQFGANIVLFDRDTESDALTVFDKSTPVEKSEEKIIEAIVSKLDEYSSEVRGKEHDKLVEGFRRIGEELGYIAKPEMTQKGARVDVVWFERSGKVQVAIEVETSAQWKKDIVTTWETSPMLAVILTHYKTDKGVEDIVQYNLLQYMPHKLLFVSYLQKKAYLIERGKIVRAYDVKPAD